MPSVVHPPLINTTNFMLKEKSGEPPFLSAFTAVNGRTSPPSPRSLNGMNGMTSDTIHVRPIIRDSPDHRQESKVALPGREAYASPPRLPENGRSSSHHSVSPPFSGSTSPNSPGKRKRSSSTEDGSPYHSPEDSSAPSRRRLDSYATIGRGDSPSNPVHQRQHPHMEHARQRTLPPMERADTERPWPSTSQDMPPNGYQEAQHLERRLVDASQSSVNTSPTQTHLSGIESGMERSSTTEVTRAGVHVDPKKRKRQFANRTKTGCGTCRRRKKKCDEAKPECNNCLRGGFICEGYANKVPWPKNGTTKPHPPLQAKDRFPVDPAQLYHSHGNREGYPDPNTPNGVDGGRGRPIVVEEHDRPARNGWGTSWGEPPRASYPPEHQQPSEYPQPPPGSSHGRPPSSEHHVPHPTQGPPPPRQHNPRIYHHTPQTMSQVVNNSPVVTAEAALHHQAQQSQPPHQPHQHPLPPPTAGPPAPPPSHYGPPPPRPQRSEKEKMLNGEPFMPFARELVDEREKCKGAVFRFNNTSNGALEIAPNERDRQFLSIIAARWVSHFRTHDTPRTGHCARDVFVDTPFMCDYGYNISIAEGVDIATGCKFLDSGRITIGRNTTIDANVTINTQKLPTDSKAPKGRGRTAIAADVHVGESVYIGANCVINAGIRIGNGAIVHPGSVVARDIPRDTIVRGNPAQVVSVNWDD